MESNFVKIITYVPETHSAIVREAMGDVGAGKIGNYSFCSFTSKGTGRFIPLDGAKPFLGEIGKIEEVAEEKIEVICSKEIIAQVIDAIKKSHPYEEPAYEIIPMLKI